MAQAGRWAGRVVAHQEPCRGLPPFASQPVPGRVVVLWLRTHARWCAVSQRCVATQGRVVGPFWSRYKICIATLVSCRARCSTCRHPQPRIVSHCCAVSQPWRIVSRSKVAPLSHDTIFLYRVHGRPYRGRAQLCRAPLLERSCLRACSACCVSAQPVVCLLSLLCAYSV